jgi:hypothetical protein
MRGACREQTWNDLEFGEFTGAFSSQYFIVVDAVEDMSTVDDASHGSPRLMRTGTHIAHKAQGFHRGFYEVCGSGGKSR